MCRKKCGEIRRSSASPRPPCDGISSVSEAEVIPLPSQIDSLSIWPSSRQTPDPPCPYPSDRTRPDAITKHAGPLVNEPFSKFGFSPSDHPAPLVILLDIKCKFSISYQLLVLSDLFIRDHILPAFNTGAYRQHRVWGRVFPSKRKFLRTHYRASVAQR